MTLKALPAVAQAGAATREVRGRGGVTRDRALVPVMDPLETSVAVTVWLPAVTSVTPLLNGEHAAVAGHEGVVRRHEEPTPASLLAKWTVPV